MKKGKFKSFIKFIVPFFILIAGVAFIFVFEFYIKDTINKGYVVVAKDDIDFKHKITANDIQVKAVKLDDIVSGSYSQNDVQSIVNGYAAVAIKKGTQLYPDLIDHYNIVPDETKGEFVAQLPSKWLFAVPGSLRKAYIADIYAVGTDQQKTLQTTAQTGTQAGNSVMSDAYIKSTLKPILTDVVVTSVKDSSNKEIVDQKSSDSSQMASSGSVSSLEIIATQDTLAKIEQKTNLGYQLYVVYKFDKSDKYSNNGN